MQIGDWVRSRINNGYHGIIVEVRKDINLGYTAQVLWQGMSCSITWELQSNLVLGVEDELMSWRPS